MGDRRLSPILYQNLLIVPAAVRIESIRGPRPRADGKKGLGPEVNGGRIMGNAVDIWSPWGRKRNWWSARTSAKFLGSTRSSEELLWTCRGIDDYMCPTAVADQGIVYAVGGLTAPGAIAVKAGGRGDVTESHRLWAIKKGSNVSSPVYHEGHLYWAHDESGVVYCADAKTGKIVYQERPSPPAARIYASATLADGKLYYVSRSNGTCT